MENRRLLSPAEFAKATGIGIKTVRRRLKAGQLPADQSGGPNTLWLIDYDAFLGRLTGAALETSPTQSAARAFEEIEKRISGPPPKWTRRDPSSNRNRGYGPKKKTN